MKTPLYDEHIKLNAKMTQFAGWDMPLYYSGIVDEVNAVRTSVGLFDLSHMGELFVNGLHSLEFLQHLTTNDVSKLRIGDAQYTLLCNENGGILDDLIIYKLDEYSYMLVVNASNTDSDYEWIRSHRNFDVKIENRSKNTSLIAVQGPLSSGILSSLVNIDMTRLGRFKIENCRVGDIDSLVARTGYTGEDGFEIYCSNKDSVTLWKMLYSACIERNGLPVGLAARDVLRLEAGYPLYGNELNTDVTPVEAGLMWVVKHDKGDFISKLAITDSMKQGPSKVLAGIIAENKCVPRHGNMLTDGSVIVGEVTSGTFSPTLGKGIALAYVENRYRNEGSVVFVQSRGRECACKITKTPFIQL